ncbi:hypothetical protein N7541_002199 [Penicillium brevicompactum]|uniref:Uncharacterized protein n=1 Tax=Penicillium brevicompactum TaxID=5074 RepID=A0A9W9RJG9_PENBR|nr:hypothetical protein N7541_002199 [Penicillium brevicompactum]
MSLSGKDVQRDGFIYGLEGFRAYPGPMKRIEGPQLRLMFLPKLTYQAQTLFRSNPGLVRSQLRHYGVQFDENNFAGRGTVLLKKVLEQGQCDQVPLSITLLQDEMLQEWLHQFTDAQLSDRPDLMMEKYFSSQGQPDHTKFGAGDVLEVPFDGSNPILPSQMMHAASQLIGLGYQQAPLGPPHVFMGWDTDAVADASRQYALREYEKIQDVNRITIQRDMAVQELADREEERIKKEKIDKEIDKLVLARRREYEQYLRDREEQQLREENELGAQREEALRENEKQRIDQEIQLEEQIQFEEQMELDEQDHLEDQMQFEEQIQLEEEIQFEQEEYGTTLWDQFPGCYSKSF